MHIGPALAEARTEAGMTVEDVSERTRIRRTIINDIERDDYASCGGDFYARGHIRAIAKVVGADPVPLIEEYDESVQARDNTEVVTGPDPATWLQAEGRGDPLLWRPPAAGPGPDTLAMPPPGSGETPPPAAFGADGSGVPPAGGANPAPGVADTAPQPAIPAVPSSRAPAPAALLGAAAAPARARAAVQRAADGLAARSGWLTSDGFRGGVADLRRITADAAQRLSRLRTAEQGQSRIIGAVAILLAALILVLYGIFSGPAHSSPRPAHGSHPVRSARPAPARHSPASTAPAAAKPSVTALRPLHVAAFGTGGVPDGDNAQQAAQALSGRDGGWHTNWYTSAHFGNLQSGTGLLLDLGRTMTVTQVTVRLGPAAGAGVQLRAGDLPALGALRPVAAAVSGGSNLLLRPGGQTQARYLLIWFTQLPRDSAGTYQVTIRGVTILGYGAR